MSSKIRLLALTSILIVISSGIVSGADLGDLGFIGATIVGGIPFSGTFLSGVEAIQNPTTKNIDSALGNLVVDVGTTATVIGAAGSFIAGTVLAVGAGVFYPTKTDSDPYDCDPSNPNNKWQRMSAAVPITNYKADPEKARQEWATASWINANGGPDQACSVDVDGMPFSSSGSSSSEDSGSVDNNVNIEVSPHDPPDLPSWSEVPPCL